MNPICYILIGPPASGKSTYRTVLAAQHPDAVFVSNDDIIDEFAAANGMTYSEAWHVIDQDMVDRLMRTRFRDAISARRVVVVDRTNMTVKSRRRFLSQLPKGYKKVGVVFNVPRDVLDIRLKTRAEATGKHIPAAVVDSMIASYQEPIIGEFDSVLIGGIAAQV